MTRAAFKSGDVVIWWKRTAGEFVWPVKAVVLAVTSKRVKIQTDDPEEGQVVRHVAPASLQHHQEKQPAKRAGRDKLRPASAKPKRPPRLSRDSETEQRITDEIIVDCYGPEEQAMGWYYYLERQLHVPFTAVCVTRRVVSPLHVGDEVEVIGMPPEEECEHEMFVLVRWEKDGLAVPLVQLEAVVADEETTQAVEDWHYWVQLGYRF